jgi:alpha-galactosidase
MLEVGNGGMTGTEYRTHMSLWALLAAPLLAGNDLGAMTEDTVSILTNRDVIAVDQDPLGRQGDRVRAEGPLEVWSKPLSGGAQAVGLFNLSDFPAVMSLEFSELGYRSGARARDLWAGRDLGRLERFSATVPAHGVTLLRLAAD